MAHPALLSPRLVAYHAGTLADAQTCRTPASAYARERRILKAYKAQLFAADLDALLLECFPDKRTLKQIAAAEDRLQYEVPELIEKLQWDEQPAIEAMLTEGDLVGTIRAVLTLERVLLQREQPNTAPDDLGHIKAAGMGCISSQNYGKLHPGARAEHRRAAKLHTDVEPLQSVSTPVTPITQETPPTPVAPITPVVNTLNAWPHAGCAVCPGPALRSNSPKAKARKRLQFEYRR